MQTSPDLSLFVRQSLLVEALEVEAPSLLSHCSSAELVLRTRAENTEAKGSVALEVVTRQLVKTQQTEKTWCVL
jgi:hypothetical protein